MWKLSVAEKSELEKLVKIIKEGQKTFFAVGQSVVRIHDQKLWRESAETFEDFCLKTFGWTANYARRIKNSYVVVEELAKQNVPIGTLSTESQTRAIAQVPKSDRVETLRQALKSGKPLTAKLITETHAKTNTNPVPSEPSRNGSASKTDAVPEVLDSTHYPIPPHPLEYWNRRGELDSLIQKGKEIKSAVARALEKDDRLFSAEIRNTFLSDIGDVISQLLAAVPYAVCPYCQGKLVKDCTFCKQRGIVGEMMYKTVPPELKKVRDAITRK